MGTFEDYIRRFAHLNTDRGRNRYPAVTLHRAPHKPVLLLSVMDHIAEGLITENIIPPSQDLVDTFNTYIALVLPAGWKTSMAHPFPRLQTDGFWHRVTNPGFDPAQNYNVTSISKLQEIYNGAKLDEELFLYMADPVARLKLRAVLISTYFAEEIRTILLEQSQVNLEAYQYSRQLLTDLQEGAEEWGAPEKAKVRDQGFRRTIVQLYEHRCAICGIRILTPEGHTVVEAAHIKPWSECQDDLPSNGVALCRLCHWSFDEGFVSIGGNFEVLVSELVQNEPNRSGHIGTFENRPIIKPANEIYWPGQENTAWHREHKFR
jgi:putative restriction endonuclease